MPLSFDVNPYVSEMFNFVTENFRELDLNSCLINFYPDCNSHIPDHSDNESHIAQSSYILTISLGSSRKMFFKDKDTGLSLVSVALDNGDVLLFSRESQDKYTHGIPPSLSFVPTGSYLPKSYLPRVSATFRCLRDI